MQALSIVVLMQCVSRAQVHCHVNARLIMDCLPQGCMYTGTPMFMAIPAAVVKARATLGRRVNAYLVALVTCNI